MKSESAQFGQKYIKITYHDNGAISVQGNIGENGKHQSFSFEEKSDGSHITNIKDKCDELRDKVINEVETSHQSLINFLDGVK